LAKHTKSIPRSFEKYYFELELKEDFQGLNQKEQSEVLKKFIANEFNVLVCTSVAEEGIDIGDVDLIVCFDAHPSPTRLVQRMGRTGRKREGRCVMLLSEGRTCCFNFPLSNDILQGKEQHTGRDWLNRKKSTKL
jgi:ERCC4-related helicase